MSQPIIIKFKLDAKFSSRFAVELYKAFNTQDLDSEAISNNVLGKKFLGRIIIFFICIFGIISIISLLLLILNRPYGQDILPINIIAFLIFSAVYYFAYMDKSSTFLKWINYALFSISSRLNPALTDEMETTFNEEGVVAKNLRNNIEVHYKWNSFIRFDESQNLFFLFLSNYHSILIPKICFFEGEIPKFKDLVNTKLDIKIPTEVGK